MSPLARILLIIGIIGAIVALVLVPGSFYFSGEGLENLIWIISSLVAVAIGSIIAAFIWRSGSTPVDHDPYEIELPQSHEKKPRPRWQKLFLGFLAIATMAAIMFIPTSSIAQGENLDAIWVLAGIAAIILGGAIAYWLSTQSELSEDEIKILREQHEQQLYLPEVETKTNYPLWIGIIVFLAGGILTINISGLTDDYPWLFFPACGLALILGIILAIIALRRIDEEPPVEVSLVEKEQQPEQAATWWVRLITFVFLAGAAAGLIIIPTSSFFGLGGSHTTLSFLASGAAILIGIGLGYWLIQQALASTHDLSPEEIEIMKAEKKEEKPPSTMYRFTILIVGIGLSVFVAGVPAGEYFSGGQDYTTGWFLAALASLFAGALIAYFLKLQAEASQQSSYSYEEPQPFKFPPWFKWVTLIVLAGALILVAVFASDSLYFQGSSSTWSWIFSAGAALVGGTGLGIWISRRFDEMAQEAAKKRKQQLAQRNNDDI